MIALESVSTFGRARQATRRRVDALIESIQEVGLLNPITVCATDQGYALVAGLHRLEACRALGWTEIPAVVVDLDEQQRIIAECDENLCAPTLTASERAEFTRRRKDAYEALHPETAHGANQHTRGVADFATPTFSDDQAAKTGQAPRTVRLDAERGEKVCDEAMALIRNTRLDTGKYLDSIKALAPDEQVARVNADLAEPVAPKPKAAKPANGLTVEALTEENDALKIDLATAKAKLEKVTRERDDLKAKLADHTSDDKDAVIRRMSKEVENLRSARFRAEENAAVWSRQVHALKKRVAELEDTPVQMDAA